MTVKVLRAIITPDQLRTVSMCMTSTEAIDRAEMHEFDFIAQGKEDQKSKFGHFEIDATLIMVIGGAQDCVVLYKNVTHVEWGPASNGDYMYAVKRADGNYSLNLHTTSTDGVERPKVFRLGMFDCESAFEAVFKQIMSGGVWMGAGCGLYDLFLTAQKEDQEAAEKKRKAQSHEIRARCTIDFKGLCALSAALTSPPVARRAIVYSMVLDGVVISTTSMHRNRFISGRAVTKFSDIDGVDNWTAYEDVSEVKWGPTPSGDTLTATRTEDGLYTLVFQGPPRDPNQHPKVAEFGGAVSAYRAAFEMVGSEQYAKLHPGFCNAFEHAQQQVTYLGKDRAQA